MALSQIFQYLTRKQINNTLTIVPVKPVTIMFLEQKNISMVAVTMYNSMKVLNRPDYFQYKDRIGKIMNEWIWKQELPADDIEYDYAEYLVKRLNNDFIKSHQFLIMKIDMIYTDGQTLPIYQDGTREYNNGNQKETYCSINPDNVYRDKFKIISRDANGNLVQSNKAGKDMMPSDYQNWDVWKKIEVDADFDFNKYRSFRGKYGYVNDYKVIPRLVDRDPETFGLTHRDPLRASLTDSPRIYDNDEYYRAKGLK